MKNLVTTILLLCSISLFSQELTKDTIYLEWRNDKFFEVTETLLDNGQRQLNERPLGDTIETLQFYMNATEEAFGKLTEAARVMVQKNAIIQNVNKFNSILSSTLNTDLIVISNNIIGETLQGDYNFKLPNSEITEAKVDENLTLKFGDNSIRVIPIGSNYIQLMDGQSIYELYRLGDGQYVSLDAQTVLLKTNNKN